MWANTRKNFADGVGPTGGVHAFEPVPASAAVISELVQTRPWISVYQASVADDPGELVMEMDAAGDGCCQSQRI